MIETDVTYYGARSLSGHDAGTVYIVIKDEGKSAWVADGRLRSVDNPKKKNKKHIQLIHIDDDILKARKQSGVQVRDEEIRTCLKTMLSR